MRISSTLRVGNNQTLDALRRSISKTISETTPYLNTLKEKNREIMYQKFVNMNKWYTRIIGLDQVQLSQDRVTAVQEQLLQTQEKRREVGRQLAEIRQKSLEIQDELHKVKRQDDLEKFLELMKKETEVLKLEKSIAATFQLYDQTERELFTAFTNAIRDSHEKQRSQLEYTKYFGLILSIAGSFLAFCYTTVRKQDLKNFIEVKLATIAQNPEPVLLNNILETQQNTIEAVKKSQETLHEVVRVLHSQNNREIDLRQINMLNAEELQENTTRSRLYGLAGGICLLIILIKSFSST